MIAEFMFPSLCFSLEVNATHLLTASVMSAPASLAIAKTFWPETEIPSTTDNHDLKMDKGYTRGQNKPTQHIQCTKY